MSGYLALWDWRRNLSALYADIRAASDPSVAHRMWRDRRRSLFKEHQQSPLDEDQRGAFHGPFAFDYDPKWRFAVPLEPIAARPVSMDTGDDGTLRLVPFARTRGLADALGAELLLYWIATYGGGAFLPFRDATNGTQTYGGGRYLLDTVKSADLGSDPQGRVVLDFNFSYYPSCAYSSRFLCPLAPSGSTLPVPIRAGERQSPDESAMIQCCPD